MGGGAMRAASKLAGIAANTWGVRGFSAERFPFSSASRQARPAAAEDVKLLSSQSDSVVPKPCSRIDDWVFAGEEEEEVVASAGEPMPRVVFGGGVPTLEEAKEATSQLTDALQKTYLSSPNAVGYKGSDEAHNGGPSLSRFDKQIGEMAIGSAVPAPAIMAFKFLKENSMAQNVVASIASDPNVWNAVSQNSELQDFLRSQRACSFGDNNLNNMKSVIDSDLSDCSSVKSGDDSSDPGNAFMDILQDIKGTVVVMMSDLSDYFQGFFGGKGFKGIFVNSDGTARLSAEALMEGSFMGLAVMAILVILLKRV